MVLKENGRVNNKKFYETVILKEIPDYNMQAWYAFLRRFKTEAGIVPIASGPNVPAPIEGAEVAVQTTLLDMQEATKRALALAMNISVAALEEIQKDPSKLSEKERAKLFAMVMKSQDSRVKAIGGIRSDTREQERFDRMMGSGAFV